MTIFDEISIIANKLANQDITPTVALIKSKLRQPVPLPQIISTLKQWQHEPNFTQLTESNEIENSLETTTPKNEDELIQIIQTAIKPLQDEINQLNITIQKLLLAQDK